MTKEEYEYSEFLKKTYSELTNVFINNKNIKKIILLFDFSLDNVFSYLKKKNYSNIFECINININDINNILKDIESGKNDSIKNFIKYLHDFYEKNALKLKSALALKKETLILDGNFYSLFPTVFLSLIEIKKEFSFIKNENNEIVTKNDKDDRKIIFCFNDSKNENIEDIIKNCFLKKFNNEFFINIIPSVDFNLIYSLNNDKKIPLNFLNTLYFGTYTNNETLQSLIEEKVFFKNLATDYNSLFNILTK